MAANLSTPVQGNLHLSSADPELAALLDSVDCGVWLFNSRGELRAANDRLAEMLHLDPQLLRKTVNFETLVARLVPNFASPEALGASWRRRFRSDEASWDELELVRPARKVIERFARPVLDRQGQRLGWLEVYRDVTAQRMVAKKMFHTDRMAALGQLMSSIAHELNNPLTSILGFAQLLKRRKGDAGQDREVEYIFEQAERASRIAKNLLMFAREANPEHVPVNLNEIAERTLALRNYELRLENIKVESDLEHALPLILADAGQIQQVLLNLLFNAEQALEQRGGAGNIRVRTRKISAQRVAIEITDDGPGIAPEVLPRIFDPFFTTKPPGVGTGLGLSIVYGIVQEHRGVVVVESVPGHGATFKVELPMAQALASGAPKLERPPSYLPQPSVGIRSAPKSVVLEEQRRGRILVVEDEPTVARLIADVLREEGHFVDVLLDSRQGLLHIEQARAAYDLVICDLRMPHLDGAGFYRELRRRDSPLARRLVFVTGDILAPSTIAFLKESGLPYLAKPFLVEQLKALVCLSLAPADRRRAQGDRRRSGSSARRAKKR